ncbi:MAG TPA: hypothetical protein VNG95_06735, partial [Gemmatimonadales bacterium]|nr:hypothetical protein [Gemmatimonadales bacterium]
MRRFRAGVVLFLLYAARVSPAAAQLDPSGTWRTLHTAHFRVHFRPAERAIALRAAREAERAYALLAAELRVPRRTVDLALDDDVDAGNGLTTVFPTPRIVVNLAVPATDPALASYDDWLRVVITHELTHAFHLDRTRGPWRFLQAVFGRAPGLFPEEYQPSWVTEGLATYYESKVTTAGRVRGSFHTEILAADAAGGESRRPWDALLYTPWPDGFMPYAYGSRFFHHIADSLGDSIVPRFVEWTAGQWIPFRVGRPLDKVGGKNLLAEAWAPATRPAISQVWAVGTKAIVRGLRASPTPEVSPDGRRVAWLSSDGRGAPRVVIADATTFKPIRTHRVTGQVTFTWTGDTLVIAQLDFTSLYVIRSDLYRWTPDGRWRRMTHAARITEPRGGGGVLASVVVDPAGNHPALPALPDTVGATWGDVVPSPDGRTIAATRQRNGRWALVRWPRAAPDSLTVLFAPGGVVSAPVWAPDGTLFFVADAVGFPQVMRWTPAAGIAVVTGDSLGARDPAPLPGGDLLYTSVRSDGWILMHAWPASRAADTTTFVASFDTAAAVTSRETGYDAWPS